MTLFNRALIDPNKRTIETYNRFAYDYIHNTAPTMQSSPHEMQEWIDTALSEISKNGEIFEIGTALPRDASYMRSKGYTVLCSDAAINFVKIMQSQNEHAILFNALEDKFPNQYDMIFANGVFPHFTQEEALVAFRNIRGALKKDGILAFSVKQGSGEEWIEEKIGALRFAHYWSVNDIRIVLEQEKFSVIFTSTNSGEYPSHRWINFIARKLS